MSGGPLLIFGTSLAGKSTLAARVSAATGWEVLSTDRMGRHPGRPWKGAPEPVIAFYEALPAEAIHWFLRVHHDNLWPLLRPRIEGFCEAGEGIVEGAALRPEKLVEVPLRNATVVGLQVDPKVLAARVERESGATRHGDRMRRAIGAFTERCLREDEALGKAARTHGFDVVDVSSDHDADAFARDLTSRLS